MTDSIRKTVLLHAPLEKVWRAISEPSRFGAWFGVEFSTPFVAGEWAVGQIVPTKVDPEVAALQAPHAGTPFRIFIERIEPMTLFAFRWHPFAAAKDHDYSQEPTTLVTFELAETEGGVVLTITESGFDNIPADRRDAAMKANDGGWTHQTRLIGLYLALEGKC